MSIHASQDAHAPSRPPSAIVVDSLRRSSTKCPVWIPDEDKDLQFRLVVTSNSGVAGHRGGLSTELALSMRSVQTQW